MIRKFITAAVATTIIGTTAIAIPTTAEARGGFGVGLATGLVGGAIVGGAIANSQNHYYGPGYNNGPVYEDGYYGCHRVLFRDEFGNEHWRRVCR